MQSTMPTITKPIVLALTTLFMLCLTSVNSQSPLPAASMANLRQNYPANQLNWVESTLDKMSVEERIGQLFMVAAYSDRDYAHQTYINSLIKQHHIGGLIFFQGTPLKQTQMINFFQQNSKTPLLIAIDGEWGLSMRLKQTQRFPKQLTLGAIQDDRLIYKMGSEIARQCKRVGVHINFAPVIDVNNNPNNPVINDRSFGEDKYNVSKKGIEYMRGMEMNGVLACGKHFPGHGDTDLDSHYALPVIKHDINHLRNNEFYPFQEMIKQGVGGMMVAHLSIPALDDTPIKAGSTTSMPTTLSKKVVTDLLKNEMGYKGLIFTDALNMKGVSSHFPPGIVDVKALLAGNDVLLFPENVGQAVIEIKKAIKNGDITQEEIDNRVRKILRAKYRVGLDKWQPLSLNHLDQDLNTKESELLIQQLYEKALTLARDDYKQIPFKELEKKQFGSLALGASTLTTFQTILGKYAPIAHHSLRYADSQSAYNSKFEALKNKSHVIISLHNMSKSRSKNYGISNAALDLIKRLEAVTNVTVVVFGSPYSLKNFDNSRTVLMSYEENYTTQSFSAQLLFGGIPAKGKLPVTASPAYRFNQGETTYGSMRFKYTMPEDVGINSDDLLPIDDIVREAINEKATPGCQVLVAKNGKVIFEKSYGYHTYGNRVSVKNSDLYDLASVTKISASMLGIMEMYEVGRLQLSDHLQKHLPETNNSNKKNLVLSDIMVHEAGLRSWIPFYEPTMAYSIYNKTYNSTCNEQFSVPVAKNMYMDGNYQQTIWQTIYESPLPNVGEYKYSDLGYYLFKKILEEKYAHKPLNEYLEERYYKPLGLSTLCFKPTERFSTYSIIPSENDTKWRKQVVHGYVHDMGAAMMGGVAGHAGVFSNANDLAVVMQMLLNGGQYGGRYYFSENTIKKFTSYQKKSSRRGLGFDKPEPNPRYKNPTSDFASSETFGHTGFTGTCTWVDPKHDLVYVFLSNRTYPSMKNYKLIKQNTRTKIQDVIYKAIAKADANNI